MMNMVLPGRWGTKRSFQRTIGDRILKGHSNRRDQREVARSEEAQHRLQHALRDYLLRRTKERYASELPPKTNYVVYCELTDEQRAVYQRVLASKDVQNVLGHKKQGIAKLCACGSGSVTAACCGRGPVWKRVHRPGGRHNGRACKRCPVTCIGLACIDLLRKVTQHPDLLQHDPSKPREVVELDKAVE